MNIVYIHQYFTTRDGMSGTRSYENAKYLVRQGHRVTVVAGDSMLSGMKPVRKRLLCTEYETDGIRILAVSNPYSNYMSYFWRIVSFLKFMAMSSLVGLSVRKADIVFATSTPLTVAVPALLLKKLRGVPFVFEVRDLWPEAPIQMGAIRSPFLIRLLRWFERYTYREARHIVTLSPGMSDGVLATGVPESKVTMVPNCCDLDLFGQNRDESAADRYNLERKFVVVHGGSMGVANGLDYIVDAAIRLKEKGDSDVVFVLTGDGKTRPALEKRCVEHKLDNVLFTGAIPRKSMPQILNMADMAITCFKNVPILYTNSPNKFFDALAAGLPVIVNSPGWTKDIVEKHGIGFYVPPDKPEALADLLLEWKMRRDELKEMGRRARALAEEQYDRIRLARQIERVLLSASDRNRQTSWSRGPAADLPGRKQGESA